MSRWSTVNMPFPLGQQTCRPLDVEQARLLEAASPMPLMVADVDPDGFSVLAIDSLLRRFVTGARHPAGPIPGELIPASGFGAIGPAMTAAASAPFEQQILELPIGDEPFWFDISVTPVVSEGTCEQILVMAADRTADHDIEQRQRRSTARFQAMVAHAPGLILLVDSTGRIVVASPGVERLLGVDPSDLQGRPMFELLHPDTLARAASMFNHVLSQPGDPIHLPDFRMSHVSGSQLWCDATATNLLHDDDVAAIVFNAHDITERRMAEHRLELSASTDALTGLANRRHLELRLTDSFEEAAHLDCSVGLALVDLDDFKLVNDTLGHDIGDGVLRTIADRLSSLIADRGSVARIGGDEFALVLDELEHPDELDRLSEAIHEYLRTPVTVSGNTVYVRASVGVTSGRPERADANSLLRSADLALYRAKRNGRNQTVRYTAELHLEAEDRLRTITELQRAIRDGRLRLAYQPIVDSSGQPRAAEALLRWDHNGELVSPATFLELAEDTGLILPIGAWVMDQACQDLRALREAVPNLDYVSINLSSRQLLDERLPMLVRRTLLDHGVASGDLAVEIGGDALLLDERATRVLTQLEHVGILLAVGDLDAPQTHAALGRLGTLSVGGLKLGRQIVQQLDVDAEGRARASVQALLELAAEHDVDVIAEAVETETQARVLRELGCGWFQGFLFSHPLDLGSFITYANRT